MDTTDFCQARAHFRVRALGLRTFRTDPALLRELATKDARVAGNECHVDCLPDYDWEAFNPTVTDGSAGLCRCSPAALAAAVWDVPPAVLLTHDVSRARELFGPGLTATQPWVDTRRVAARMGATRPRCG